MCCGWKSLRPVLLLIIVTQFVTGVATAQTNPAFPTPQLEANVIFTNSIFLRWNDVEGESLYHIERKIDSDPWTEIAVVAADSNSYTDRDVVQGTTYTYRVRASNRAGPSEYSNEVPLTTPGPTLMPPAGAPILYADPASHTMVGLKWTDIEGETQYRIERKNRFGQWHEIGAVGGNSGNFLDDELSPRTLYNYRVRGWNHGGFSPYSNEAAATTLPDPEKIPAAPRVVSWHHTDTSIQVQWDPIEDATGYRLEAKTGAAGTWTEIANVSAAGNVYTHENLTHSTQYFYRIRACNAAGISEYSSEWQATTLPPPPPSPELQATARSYKEIELHWKDVLTICCTANGYIGYRLQFQRGTEWEDLEFAGVDDTNHFVRALQPSTEYSFRIMALNPLASDWSTVLVKTLDPPPIPPQVAPVLYADPASSSSARLKWLDVELETEYRLERKNSAGQWEQLASAPANSLFYIDSGLQPSTSYAYRLRAINSYGASPYSNEAGAITRPPPHPPEVPILNGGASSQTVVQLFWEAAQGATLYRLERKNAAGDWETISETTSEPFRYNDTGLTPHTLYTYRLGGRNAAGIWFYSAEVTDRTYPPQLTQAPVVSGKAVSSSAIELSWQPMPFAENYYVAKLIDGGWTHTQLSGTATNYTDANLSPSTVYMYIVYARNDVSSSPETPPITVTTHAAISGAISFRSISLSAESVTFRLAGSAGQKFKIQSSSTFGRWNDVTETLTLSPEMQVSVSPQPETKNTFYRTIRAE